VARWAAESLAFARDIESQGFSIVEAHIDRAYVNSPVFTAMMGNGGGVFCSTSTSAGTLLES